MLTTMPGSQSTVIPQQTARLAVKESLDLTHGDKQSETQSPLSTAKKKKKWVVGIRTSREGQMVKKWQVGRAPWRKVSVLYVLEVAAMSHPSIYQCHSPFLHNCLMILPFTYDRTGVWSSQNFLSKAKIVSKFVSHSSCLDHYCSNIKKTPWASLFSPPQVLEMCSTHIFPSLTLHLLEDLTRSHIHARLWGPRWEASRLAHIDPLI